jgi:predicted phosphodiesterase
VWLMALTQEAAKRAVVKHGGQRSAARALGVSRDAIRTALGRKGTAAKPDPAVKIKGLEKDIKDQSKLILALETALAAERKAKVAQLPKPRRVKLSRNLTRVVIPDSHGEHIDWPAAMAMVADIALLKPDEIVWIGDHLDCGGTLSVHQRSYTRELTHSYTADVAAANQLLDLVMHAAPNARHHYLEGNHEQHVERWAVREWNNPADAEFVLDRLGPVAVLKLKERGIPYYRMCETYCGLTTPGMIKLGNIYYTHGFRASKHATATMTERVGSNLVHGHTHRGQAHYSSTTESYQHGGWCFGTLAQRHPLYMHTAPTDWSVGYGVQFVSEGSENFMTFAVPIFGDRTLLRETVDSFGRKG